MLLATDEVLDDVTVVPAAHAKSKTGDSNGEYSAKQQHQHSSTLSNRSVLLIFFFMALPLLILLRDRDGTTRDTNDDCDLLPAY